LEVVREVAKDYDEEAGGLEPDGYKILVST